MINALPRKAKDQFESPPYREALVRCYQAATIALLPADKTAAEALRPGLQTFFARADVQKELGALVRGRELDREQLAELFAESTATQPLPGFDFEAHLANF